MKLHSMGMNFHHESDFAIQRPTGSGDNLLIIFKTPAIVIENGISRQVNADSAIAYSKNTPQLYSASGGNYINHWLHFEADENDEFFRRINLPFDTVINISDITAVENVMLQLNEESLSDDTNKDECVDLLLRLILTKLCSKKNENRHNSIHSESLRKLRADIYSNPSACHSVSYLAESVSLSPSHFQALYKSEFGISCYEDVINAKIKMAKYYLKNTALAVSRIAELCGYENDVHFIRQFKSRTGVTASEYRKKHYK